MKAKDKAKELVEKFEDVKFNDEYNGEGGRDTFESFIPTDGAKQCALIAVDEIINALPEADSSYQDYQQKEESINYWQEVKQEIEKL